MLSKKADHVKTLDPENRKAAPLISRRIFLQWAAAGAASVALPTMALAEIRGRDSRARALSFFNTHTEEELNVVYWANGKYRRCALARIDHLLRDHRSGEVQRIDTKLLDLLHALGKKLGTGQPFHVISGYRSPKTNEMLRAGGRGVASKSMHLYGKAVDIRLPGCGLRALREAALEAKAGGVGYYPEAQFVHVDVGRVRFW